MKEFIAWLFSEHNSTLQINLLDKWHFLYLFVIFGAAIVLSLVFRRKSAAGKSRILRLFAYLTIGLYIADFFIMPLSDSYGHIGIDKLPYHICTLMSIMAAFVQFNPRLKSIKTPVVTLAITSSLMWMCYPGSALGGQPPFCYRTFQTFMFHGLLFIWAVLNLSLGEVRLRLRDIWKEFAGILIIFVWASFGNAVYPGEQNWFFIHGVLFDFVPLELMPISVIASVFLACLVIYGAYFAIGAIAERKKSHLV
jgi:hypothetical protein